MIDYVRPQRGINHLRNPIGIGPTKTPRCRFITILDMFVALRHVLNLFIVIIPLFNPL